MVRTVLEDPAALRLPLPHMTGRACRLPAALPERAQDGERDEGGNDPANNKNQGESHIHVFAPTLDLPAGACVA
jgi:hypothetical protein